MKDRQADCQPLQRCRRTDLLEVSRSYLPNEASPHGCVSPLEALDGADYGLARPLFIYVAKSAKDIPAVKEFVDFYFETMDILVQAVGYINMPADKKASSLTAWTAFSGS